MSEDKATEQNNKRSLGHLAGKYLTLAVSEEKYGLEILKVQEIIGMMHITRVPRTNDYMKGVINLRGKIIPVIDLRLKFGLPSIPPDERTCIIVVDANLKGKQVAVGVVVDTVLEVINFQGNQIEESPQYGNGLNTSFVLGMGRTSENQVIILIDIDKALGDTALGEISASIQSHGVENSAEA